MINSTLRCSGDWKTKGFCLCCWLRDEFRNWQLLSWEIAGLHQSQFSSAAASFYCLSFIGDNIHLNSHLFCLFTIHNIHLNQCMSHCRISDYQNIKKCIYIIFMYVCRQIDKSPFDNIQSDVRHEAEGGICYQLFPPIQTQGFQNKHNQNMSVYICAGF